jgi:hypothetical protein
VELVAAEEEAEHRDPDDADQDRAAHAQEVERHDGEEADDREHHVRVVQVAERNERGRIAHHDARGLQRNDGEEEADAACNRHAYGMRNAVHDHLAHADQRDDHEEAARDEHRAQRRLPREAHAFDHRIGEVGVEPHARRKRNRVVRVKAHHERGERGHEAGGHEHGLFRHACIAQNRRVHEDDVGHREKGREAREQFGAQIGARFVEAEIAFDGVHEEGPLGLVFVDS